MCRDTKTVCAHVYIYTVTVAAYKSIISVCANAKVRIPVSSQYPCSVELAHTYSCMDTHACHLNVKVYIDWGRVSNTAKGPDSPGTPKECKLFGRGPPCSGNLQTPPKVRPNNLAGVCGAGCLLPEFHLLETRRCISPQKIVPFNKTQNRCLNPAKSDNMQVTCRCVAIYIYIK